MKSMAIPSAPLNNNVSSIKILVFLFKALSSILFFKDTYIYDFLIVANGCACFIG
jgi:hypothetical protein